MNRTPRPLAIVAAAGPGMGLAVARRFAREGFDLALIARDETRLAAQAGAIAGTGGIARAFAADLTDENSIRAVMARIEAEMGPAEVLVFNAGVWREGPVLSMSAQDFQRDLMLCATSALVCTQAVLPGMRERGRGTLLFTGGGLALRPEFGAGVASLAAGKSALRGLVHAMAPELTQAGVRVGLITIAGTVAPGTAFDPDRIAELYWRHHADVAPDVETIFDGRG